LLGKPTGDVRNILVAMMGGPEIPLSAVNEACQIISTSAHPNTKILLNAGLDEDMADEVRITMICMYDQ